MPVRKDAAVSTSSSSSVDTLTCARILKIQALTIGRDVSSPEKGGGFAFLNVGTIMTGGGVRGADAMQEGVWVRGVRPSGASSRRVLGSWVRRVRGSFTTMMQSRWGSMLGACACACFRVWVRVLVFVCACWVHVFWFRGSVMWTWQPTC